MPRTDNETRVAPSLLDRLLDFDPRETREAPKSQSTTLRELRQAVRRDMEWLLNTRCFYANDGGLEEAPRSVAFYGLPDFTGFSATSPKEQKEMTDRIETAIKNFEPRFLDVKVTLDPPDNLDRQLKFRIEARLDVDPVPEPIAFDSVLQLGGGGFVVTES
jgi:type VI secretion system protein ImpF